MPGLKALTDRFPPGDVRAASRSTRRALRSASAVVPGGATHRRNTAGAPPSSSPASARCSMSRRAFCSPRAGPTRSGHCSTFGRCCVIAPPSATSSATARIASSFTACAPGSLRSGLSSWLQRGRRAVGPIAVSVIVTVLRCRRASRQRGSFSLRPPSRHHRHHACSGAVALAIGLSLRVAAVLLLLVLIYGLAVQPTPAPLRPA